MKKLLAASLLVAPLMVHEAVAQDRTISGRVTDAATGQGLPGVTVLVKGTTVGAATNSDGSFSVSAPSTATALTFSFVGYKSTEKAIGTSSVVDVALAVDTREISEVVVTGLATSVKRENLANAVATVSAKELTGTTRPVTVDAALSGKVVGANISQTSGAPGGGVSVQLRGISTINGSSQPLYIIDGVYAVNQEVGNGAGAAAFSGASSGTGRTTQDNGLNRLSDLNPSDIESIEILKGPSAAAIYGTRANAGVIIIKTKRGQAGQTRVSVSQEVGFAKAIKLLGHEDWTPAKIDLFYGPGARANDEKAKLAAAQASNGIYDYEKEIFGNTGKLTTTAASISGGTERTKFYVSGSSTNEGGIVRNTGFQRNSIRANIDQKITNRIDFGVSANYINSLNKRGYTGNDNNGLALAYNLAYIPSYAQLHKNAQGLFPDSEYTPDNPLAVVERAINRENTNRFITTATSTIRIIDNERTSLRFAAQGGVDNSNSDALLALPSDMQSQRGFANPGVVRIAKNNFFNYNMQGFLIYDWKIGEIVSLTSQVGTVRLGLQSNLTWQQGQNLAPGPLLPNRGSIVTQEASLTRETDVGYVAQQDLNFNDRLILSGGIRFDKSSRNGDPNKLYAFPKASAALNVANFDFWTLDAVNQVKLRAAYGETGGPAFFGATFSPLGGIATGGRVGVLPSTLVGNPTIGPERATELEFGADFGFLNNRVTLEATAYNKKVKDLINTFVTSNATGVTSVRAYPVGDLRNRGIELSLGLKPVVKDNFSWSTNLQYWFNRSEVTRITVPAFVTGSGFGATFGRNYFLLGESPSRWYGSPASPTDNPNTPSNLTRYQDAQPKFQASLYNSLTIAKNLEFSFLLHWKNGGYISNLSRELQDEGGTTKDWSKDSDGDGTVNGQQRPSENGTSLKEFVLDGSYVRLREVGLGYTIPTNIRTMLFKDYVAGIRLSASAYNLLTWTNYPGYDPEVSNFGATSNAAQVDVGGFPNTRRVIFRIGFDF